MFNPEIMLLASCLISETIAHMTITCLNDDNFEDENHKKIFEALKDIILDGKQPSTNLVFSLQPKYRFSSDSIAIIMSYPSCSESVAESHIYDIQCKKLMKQYFEEHRSLMANVTPQDFVKNLKKLNNKYMFERPQNPQPKTIFEILNNISDGKSVIDLMKESRDRHHAGDKLLNAFSTNIKELDDVLGHIPFGSYTILGARTSVGKTTISLALANNISKTHPCAFISLEMTEQQLAIKFMSSSISVPHSSITGGTFPFDKDDELSYSLSKLQDTPLYLTSPISLTLEILPAYIKNLIDKTEAKIFFIDYITLIKNKKIHSNKHLEIDSISKTLQHLAKKFNISIIALAQLNRQLESRSSQIPNLSDLRESGSLEEDADFVLLLDRPYLRDESFPKNLTDIYIKKNRLHGNLGKVSLELSKGALRSV